MAFKIKNPSISKMVKAAGDSRVAMKLQAESAMKMKEAAMKLERDAAMKKYVSDAQRKAVHASKAEKSAAKFNEGLRKASAEGKLDNNPKFKAAVDKSPVQLKKSAGKYGKKHDKLRAKGHKARAAADEAFDAGKKKKTERLDRRADKKLGKARDIRVKSAMKLKTFERKSGDLTQSEEARRRDRGEGRNPKQDRRNFYNEKKTRRKVEKSRKADAKARTAMAEFDAKAPKTKAAQDAMSAKDAKKVGKLGKKAAKAEQKARVKEAVASRQLSKQGSDPNRPKRPKKEKFLPIAKISGIGKTDVGPTIKHKIKDVKSGDAKARRARNKAAKQEFKADRKSYRQKTGVRGDINVRRKAKGKDVI